jgi:hypothetical protein
MRAMFFSLVLAHSISAAALDCSNKIPYQQRNSVEQFREGEILPKEALMRAQLMSCFNEVLLGKEDWEKFETTVSLDNLVFGDEGFGQVYIISIPFVKMDQQNFTRLIDVRKLYYSVDIYSEHLWDAK